MAVTADMAVPDQPEVLYVDTEEGEPYALESLCMNCHQTVRIVVGRSNLTRALCNFSA